MIGACSKINAISLSVKINKWKSVDIHVCGYKLPINVQNFMQNDSTRAKIWSKVVGGLLFWLTLYRRKQWLYSTDSVGVQDKSSSVGVHTVRRMMGDEDDVLLVNVGSGLTAAHIASLSHNSTIYAYGITSDRHQKHINRLLDHLGVRCTHVPLALISQSSNVTMI